MAISKFCKGQVVLMYRRDSTPAMGECGTYFGGRQVLCRPCTEMAERKYPQGWVGYPGDVCPHGRYTGGNGADLICGACEGGY